MPPTPRQPRTTYLLKRLERLVHRELTAAVAVEDLTASQYAALSVLAMHPGLSSAQLARRSFVTAQSMNELVAALESRSLIERSLDPANARALKASLSDHGAAVLARCDAGADEVEARMLTGLGPDRVALLRSALEAQIGNLDPVARAHDPHAEASPAAGVASSTDIGPDTGAGGVQAVAQTDRSMRSDHQRNRTRILAAARELFATRSVDEVQLEDIAAAARVGRATLFRHIGSKDALVAEVFRGRLENIAHLADTALALDAWEGFEVTVRTLARWMHGDRGLYEWIRDQARSRTGLDDEASARMTAGLDRVIARAQRAGHVWQGLRTADLIPLLGFAAEPEQDRLDEFVDVLLRGLSTRLGGA